MLKLKILRTLGIFWMSAWILGCQMQTPAKPNIIIVMVDDMGYSDIGCYGGEIPTPNIDRLASAGLKFTQFYNAARCCPTRASILTGLYPHKTGLGFMTAVDYGKPGYRAELNRECITIAEALKTAGYQTYMCGKWHVCKDFNPDGPKYNWPLQRGFDQFFGTLIAAGSQYDPLTLMEDNEFINPPQDFYYTDAIVEKSLQYIENRNNENPFFLYMAHTAPHWPLHALRNKIDEVDGLFSLGWDELRKHRLAKMIELGIVPKETVLSKRPIEVPAWEEVSHPSWQESRMEAYAAMIKHVDDGMGKLVEKLKEKHLLHNTLILFLSDNGGDNLEHPHGRIGNTEKPWAYMRYVPLTNPQGKPVISGDYQGLEPGPSNTYAGYGINWAQVSNAPFKYFKKYAYEGGISTPLIAHWPAGIKTQNEIRTQPTHVIDIMATCLELAGIPYPDTHQGEKLKKLDGISLLPVFEADKPIHEVLFWEHHDHCAVRKGDWKLVAQPDGNWELYNLKKDRSETSDLAHVHPEKVRDLEALYENWANECGVIPVAKLKVQEIPPSDNPLTRTDAEMDSFMHILNEVLKKNDLPIFTQWD